MPDTALVIIARYPEPGKTKTRLARSIGDDEAFRLYRAFLTDLAHRFACHPERIACHPERSEGSLGQLCHLHWAYTPAEVDYHTFLATIVPSLAQHMSCFPQQGTDLAARLHHIFKWTHARQFRHTIVIGSDSPHISLDIVAHARTALDHADLVLGPADDGGYYLIAMHNNPYDVFSGIPMSTSVVMQMTIKLAERQGLKVQLLKPLFDVDELPDLLRLGRLLRADASLAPATASHLATIKVLR